MAHGWGGESSQAFDRASAAWHGKTTEMSTTLSQLHGALSTASSDVSATDHSLVGLFG